MEKEGETCNDLVHQPSFDLGRTMVANAETSLRLRDVDSEKVVHPLLNEHPERGGDKADDEACKPKDINTNILGRSLEGRGRGGGVGSDHPTVSEVVTRGLIRDTPESVIHHVHRRGLETRVDSDQERGENRGEETGLCTYTIS